jgi:hypothetical protein
MIDLKKSKGKSESNIQIHPSFTPQVGHDKEGIKSLLLENNGIYKEAYSQRTDLKLMEET